MREFNRVIYKNYFELFRIGKGRGKEMRIKGAQLREGGRRPIKASSKAEGVTRILNFQCQCHSHTRFLYFWFPPTHNFPFSLCLLQPRKQKHQTPALSPWLARFSLLNLYGQLSIWLRPKLSNFLQKSWQTKVGQYAYIERETLKPAVSFLCWIAKTSSLSSSSIFITR